MAKNAWHWMDIAQICTQLDTNAASGLTRKQASSRIKKLNIRQPEALHPLFLPAQRPFYRHVGKMLLNPVMLLTLLVALIALLFGEYASLGGVMVAILLLYTLGCAFASAKAHDVWRTLQLYSNPMVKVIRGGKLYTMDARNVVPGDVVCLSEGDVCPADIRIDTGYRASVSQYVLTDRDAAGYVRISAQKDGDVLYSAEDEIHSPDCVNIIYAGSVIEQGFVRGVVVETGKHTYLGASLGTVPGTELVSEPDSTAFIRRYFSRFATVQAVLLVPLTILMTVTLRQSLSFTECFLTALALCCTAVAEYAVTLAGFVRATGMDAAASQKENAALAIVKNSTASDKLCEMTDLLLFDSAAISDGRFHPESVYAGGSIYNSGELINRDVYALAADLYYYRTATRPPESLDRDAFDVGLTASVDALIKHVSLDTEAIQLTKISSHMTFFEDVCRVHTVLKQGEYDVWISTSEDILQKCTHIVSDGERKPFDPKERDALLTLCHIYRESGYRVLLIANGAEQEMAVSGALAFASKPGYQFEQCCQELVNSGVRISVFAEDSAENMKMLTDCSQVRDQSNDVLTASRAQQQGLELHVAYGSYRAYLGFDQQQIADLIDKLKQRGNRVASLSVDHHAQALHEMADLRITCDAIEYRSTKVAQALYDKMPVDGKPFSSRATQHMRRNSDIILRRAGEQGGGLHGILTGRKCAFTVNHNIANMVTYLMTVQFFRLLLVTVPAIFGTYTLSAVSLLLCGLLTDMAAVVLFAFATPNQNAVQSSYSIVRRLEKPVAYNTANVVSAAVSALLLWLGVALLQVFEVVQGTQTAGICFVATMLLQGTVLAVTLHEYTAVAQKRKPSPVLLGAALGYVLLLVACIFVPGLNALTYCNGLSALMLAITPFAALVYFGMYRILSARGLNLHK